jgi:SAM-dependent methyltransferase
VLGFDLSGAMVSLARRAAPRARFEQASFLEVELPACDAVVGVGEVFNYLFDAANTEEALADLFRRAADALRPAGTLLFDAAGPGRVAGGGPTRSWFAADEWAVLTEAEETAARAGRAELTRRITTFRREGELYRRAREVHRLKLLSPAVVLPMLRSSGFRARVLRGYDGVAFAPAHRVYLARPRPRP